MGGWFSRSLNASQDARGSWQNPGRREAGKYLRHCESPTDEMIFPSVFSFSDSFLPGVRPNISIQHVENHGSEGGRERGQSDDDRLTDREGKRGAIAPPHAPPFKKSTLSAPYCLRLALPSPDFFCEFPFCLLPRPLSTPFLQALSLPPLSREGIEPILPSPLSTARLPLPTLLSPFPLQPFQSSFSLSFPLGYKIPPPRSPPLCKLPTEQFGL